MISNASSAGCDEGRISSFVFSGLSDQSAMRNLRLEIYRTDLDNPDPAGKYVVKAVVRDNNLTVRM